MSSRRLDENNLRNRLISNYSDSQQKRLIIMSLNDIKLPLLYSELRVDGRISRSSGHTLILTVGNVLSSP
jgi:hypothetical protein